MEQVKSMSVSELALFLQNKGISARSTEILEGISNFSLHIDNFILIISVSVKLDR